VTSHDPCIYTTNNYYTNVKHSRTFITGLLCYSAGGLNDPQIAPVYL